ncbi:10617_t:CDS:1, partial [Dentiscutata heterogama]
EILNMPMGFNDPSGGSSVPTFTNLINAEDKDHDPVDYSFGRQ